ncbi:hypothetical protein [Bradyrhizobium sp.]
MLAGSSNVISSFKRTVRTDTSAHHYNALPLLGDADDFVRANGLLDKMKLVVGDLLVENELNHLWAIYLLHHHWEISSNEFPGEVPLHEGNSLAYLMKPVARSSGVAYVPCLIGIRDNEHCALEFSCTSRASESYTALCDRPSFLQALQSALTSNNLDRHFGLGIIRPTSSPELGWVEFTQAERGSLLKEVLPGEIDERHLVQTSWAFEAREADGTKCNWWDCPPPSCWKHGNCYSPRGDHAASEG